jgi:hypothetical protein
MSKPIKRHGASYPITANAGPDWSFLKDYAAEDSDESETESREELKAKIRAELLNELHEKLVVSPTKPLPPEQALFVRAPDSGLDEFFEMAEQQKAERRRNHGH